MVKTNNDQMKEQMGIRLKLQFKDAEGGFSNSALDMAKYCITRFNMEKKPQNNVAIQTILYLIQKDALTYVGLPIHNGVFEAWDKGPVVKEVYESFPAQGMLRESYPEVEYVKGKELVELVIKEALAMEGMGFLNASTKKGGAWQLTWEKHKKENKEIPLYLIRSKG